MTTYQLETTVRTPLHIGSGGAPLRRNIDFASFGRFVYVFDTDRIFDYILPDSADSTLLERITSSANLASFLKEADFRANPGLARYRLGGSSAVSEIRPQIKDARGQLYLPGSTIKGTIRTALGTALAEARPASIAPETLDRRRERAAQGLEQTLFSDSAARGKAPNYDLMRAIQVTDSQPVAPDALDLENVAVWPAGERGIPIDVEVIRAGTRFTSRVNLDDYLLDGQAEALRFGTRAQTVQGWVAVCRAHGLEQLRQEAIFFTERRTPEIERLYQGLLQEAEQDPPEVFWTSLGWGAGWNSKTFSRVIKRDRRLMTEIISRYGLTKRPYREGDTFPMTRHVVADRGKPRQPLGWVRVRVTS